MERPYTNLEMDLKLESVKTLVKDNHDETMGEVINIGKKLGTAIERLEKHDEEINNFKAWKIGIAMSAALITVIIALVVYIYLDFKEKTENNFKDLKILISNQ